MPIIDAHAHLDASMFDIPRMIAEMDHKGIDKVVLIPAMNDPLPETPAALLAVFRGLMTSPIHCCAAWLNRRFYTADGDLRLRGAVYRIYPRPDNATVAAALQSHPDRFLGWIFLNPRVSDDPIAELERWRSVPGFVGVKLHPHWHGYPLDAALPIAKRCQDLNLPVLIHLGFGVHGRWQTLTDACPRLRVVFAHAGMPHFGRMWPAIADHANLYIDVSSPYLSESLVRRAVAAVGPQRVLFGTDAPYGFHKAADRHTYDYGHILGWVQRLPCRSGDIEQILGDNVLTLLAEQRA